MPSLTESAFSFFHFSPILKRSFPVSFQNCINRK
nr:MAG TPA: hypothetical protein [Caudoviricetes sp.]